MAMIGAVGHFAAACFLAVVAIPTTRVLVGYLQALHRGDWPSSMRFITVPHQKIVWAIIAGQGLCLLAMFVLALALIVNVARRLLRTRAICFACVVVDMGAAGFTVLVNAATAHGNKGYGAVDLSINPLLATVALCFFLGAVLVGSTRYTAVRRRSRT